MINVHGINYLIKSRIDISKFDMSAGLKINSYMLLLCIIFISIIQEILYVKSISVKGAKYLKRRLLVGDLIVKLNSRQITRQEQLKALIQTSHETEFGEATVAAQQEPETPQTSKIMLFIRRKKGKGTAITLEFSCKKNGILL